MLSCNGNIRFEAYNLLIRITVKVLRYFFMLYDVKLVLFMTRNPLSKEYLSRRKTVNMNNMVGCIVMFRYLTTGFPIHRLPMPSSQAYFLSTIQRENIIRS